MSLLVFPTLSIPGFSITCHRTKRWKTKIQEAVSGKEWRTTWWSSARDLLEFQYDFLRNGEAWRELNRVFDFFAKHGGQWDSFLVEDPEDKIAVEQYLGSGADIVTPPDVQPTFFQLQRVLRASVEGKRDGGETSGHPIFNLATASSQFLSGNAPWSTTTPWSEGLGTTIQDFAGVAPDGTFTAARFSNGADVGRDVNITHGPPLLIRQNQNTPATVWSFSIWVRVLSMDAPREIGLQLGGGTGSDIFADGYVLSGNATAAADPVYGRAAWRFTLNDTNWTRIGITTNQYGAPNQLGDVGDEYGVWLPQPYTEVLIAQAQFEVGSRFSEYVPAMDGAAMVYGIYDAGTEFGIKEPPLTVWPGIGDGSEPVHDFRPCALSEFGEHWPSTWGAGQYQPRTAMTLGTSRQQTASALDWQGKRAPHAGFTNYIRFSGDFSQSAAWTTAATGSGSSPTFASLRSTGTSDLGAARGPDGSRDYGTAVLFNVGAGTTSAATSSITQTVDHPLLIQGQQYTFSIWAFPWNNPTNDVPIGQLEIIENTSGASVMASMDRRRAIVDSRAALTFTAGASTSITIRWRGDLAAPTARTTMKVLLWGAQLERTVSGVSPTWYLPTQAAAVMAAPEVRDEQPSIYKWDQGMHPYGTLLNPNPRTNLCNGSWSTGGSACPDNPTGNASLGTTGGGTVSGASTASAITAFNGTTGYRFTTGSMLCSSVYVQGAIGITFTFGLRRDTGSNTTTNTIDFDTYNGLITRAGSRVVSAYAASLPNNWFRLVMVSTWDNADTTQTPYVSASGGTAHTYLHIVEPGRSVGSPFAGATWAGDYTILDGPTANHLTALPGTVLFPGDPDWMPLEDPPPLGVYYTWSGGYYKRMRYDGEEVTADRIVNEIWSTGSISLISVRP